MPTSPGAPGRARSAGLRVAGGDCALSSSLLVRRPRERPRKPPAEADKPTRLEFGSSSRALNMRTMLGPGNYEARATPNMKRKHLDDFEAPPNKWQRGGVTSLTPLMRNAALRSPSPAMSPGQRSVVEVLRYPCGGAPGPAAPPARTRASGVWPPAPPPGDRSAPSSRRLGGRCVTCARTTAQAVACGHCERATCASCARSEYGVVSPPMGRDERSEKSSRSDTCVWCAPTTK